MSVPYQALDSVYPFVPTLEADEQALARSIRDILFLIPASGAPGAGDFGVFLTTAAVVGTDLHLTFVAERDGMTWTIQNVLQTTGSTIVTTQSSWGFLSYLPERVPLVALSQRRLQVEHVRVRWEQPGISAVKAVGANSCANGGVSDVLPPVGTVLSIRDGANTTVSFADGVLTLTYTDRGEVPCGASSSLPPFIQSINGLTRPDIELSVSSSLALQVTGNIVRVSSR